MMLATVIAAVAVAFPQSGQRLPSLTRCYMIGATDGIESSITVRGIPVPVSRTGAWGTVIDVVPGSNVVWVSGKKHVFFVGPGKYIPPRQVSGASTAPSQSSMRPAGVASTAADGTYLKLPYAADHARPHPRGKPASEVTIFIDAGHGGDDHGAVSPHGLPEKDANLRLARDVASRLKAKGYRVMMTRTTDVAVQLYDRPKAAHSLKADAFVSIHHNAPGHSTDPTQCRYQAVYAWNSLGERLAKFIDRRMTAANPSLPSKGVLRANYAVTRSPEIPSCLVEADFITHPDGESSVWDASRREQTATAIADGISDWIRGG